MSTKIYIKRGQQTYKEKRIIKEIKPIIDKMMEQNPDMTFTPATNYDELVALRNQYVGDDAEIVSETKDSNTTQSTQSSSVIPDEDDDVASQFIDPMNREAPKVRDYVLDAGEQGSGYDKTSQQSSFAEPSSFEEAFEIPSMDDDNEGGSDPKEKKSSTKAEKPAKKEPINPAFDTMTAAKKNRKTKKFAGYIVEVVCSLAEFGFVLFATKNTNEAKLSEYEMTGEIDLTLIFTLDEGQEVTAREFFQNINAQAEELAKYSDEEKEDLTDALAEVMMEKGVTPTPMQELLLITVSVFGQKAMMLYALNKQTNMVLNQLRSRGNEGGGNSSSIPASAPEPQAEPQVQVEDFSAVSEPEVDVSDVAVYSETEVAADVLGTEETIE